MGNICDCLSNDSDGEGLVPPVTRDSRYGGLRDPVPATLPAEVVTSTAASEFSSIPPSRPVAEVHPQTHFAPKYPAAAFPPAPATSPAGDIEKVTLPPPPVKSPVKKISKEGPAAVPRPKADPVILDDPLVDVPRFQIKGSGVVTNEPIYAEIQANALPDNPAPPVPSRRPNQLPSPALTSQPAGQADDESFAEFIKDRTKSGGCMDTPTAAPAAPAAPTPAVTPIAAAPIYAAPNTVAPTLVAAPPLSTTPLVDAPLIPVNASALYAATPATLPASDPAPVDAAGPSWLASPTVLAKSAKEEERKGCGDFTEYLDKAVSQTKKTIEETVVTAKHPEDDSPSGTAPNAVASIREEEMNIVNLDSTPEKSPSPDDFVAQLAAANADVEKLPVQNSFKQMTEILTIPGAIEKDEKESSPFEIGSSESELSKPDLSLGGKSLADELSEFTTTEVDANANKVLSTPVIVGAAFEVESGGNEVDLARKEASKPFDDIAVDVKVGDGLIPETSLASLSQNKEPLADIIAIEEEISLAKSSEVESLIPDTVMEEEISLAKSTEVESEEAPVFAEEVSHAAPDHDSPADVIAVEEEVSFAPVDYESEPIVDLPAKEEVKLAITEVESEPPSLEGIVAIEEISLAKTSEVELLIPDTVMEEEISLAKSTEVESLFPDIVIEEELSLDPGPAEKVSLAPFLAEEVSLAPVLAEEVSLAAPEHDLPADVIAVEEEVSLTPVHYESQPIVDLPAKEEVKLAVAEVESEPPSLKGDALDDLLGDISFKEPVSLSFKGPAPNKDEAKMEVAVDEELKGSVEQTLEADLKEATTPALVVQEVADVDSSDSPNAAITKLEAPLSVGANVLPSPAILDTIDLELTNEDSPRLTVGDSLTGDFNVGEVFSHENVRISHSSPEKELQEVEVDVAKEPMLDLQQVVNEGAGEVEIEVKGLEKSGESDVFLSRTGDVIAEMPPIGQDLLDLDLTRETHASFDDTWSDMNTTAVSTETTSSLDASKSGDQLLASDLEEVLQSSTEEIVASTVVAASDAPLDESFSAVENTSAEISYDTETPFFEKSVDIAAIDLVDDILQASTEEFAATSIVADIGVSAANEVAAANLAEAITFSAIEEVTTPPESPQAKSSHSEIEQNSPGGKLESSIEIIQSTAEVPVETESANILISQPSADPLFFDEIDSWLSSGGGVDNSVDNSADNGVAAFVAEAADAGESSDEFIVLSKNDEDAVPTWAVSGPSIPTDLPEVSLIESQDFPVSAQLTGNLDDDDDQLLLRAGAGAGGGGEEEDAEVVGVSPVASVDSAFEDTTVTDDALAFNVAANVSSPNAAAQAFADNTLLSLDLLGPAVDVSDSFDAVTPTIDAATPTSGDAAFVPADETDAAAAAAATAVVNDYSEEEIFDDDSDEDEDEFAKIMETARKMEARAKERGDSDPAAPVGLTFGGSGGDDDFLEKLAKKISKDSESEAAAEPQPSSSHDDTFASDISPSLASDVSPNADTTDTSFFSAKSEVTLVEEPSLLDLDDALTKGVDEVLTSPSPSAQANLTPTSNDHSNGYSNGHSNEGLAFPAITKSTPREKQEEEEEEGDAQEESGRAKKKNNRRKKKKGPTS